MEKQEFANKLFELLAEHKKFVEGYYSIHTEEILVPEVEYSLPSFMDWLNKRRLRK